MATAVNDPGVFECSDAFLINFSTNIICTLVISAGTGGDPTSQAATYGRNTFNKAFIFTRGTNTSGAFKEYVTYVVDGANPTINAPPAGVAYSGAFNDVPDLNPATASPLQPQHFTYSGYLEITEGTFTATSLGVTITIGFDPT